GRWGLDRRSDRAQRHCQIGEPSLDCLVRHLVQVVTTLSTARPDLVQSPKTLVVYVAHRSLLLLHRSIHLITCSVRSSLDTTQAITATATITTTDRTEHTVLATTWITPGPRRYAPGARAQACRRRPGAWRGPSARTRTRRPPGSARYPSPGSPGSGLRRPPP